MVFSLGFKSYKVDYQEIKVQLVFLEVFFIQNTLLLTDSLPLYQTPIKLRKQMKRLVITHKDRLLRFGSQLVFTSCELKGIEIVQCVEMQKRG